MWLLATAVVVVGVIAILNLILTLGVIRRLREHSDLLATPGRDDPMRPMVDLGQRPGEFTATTVNGETITRDSFTGATLAAFLSPYCDVCEAQIPGLLDRAAAMPGGSANVLVVVIGRGDEAQAYGDRFRAVARVVVEPANGPVGRAFELGGMPTFGLLDPDGRVAASTISIERLDLPVAS